MLSRNHAFVKIRFIHLLEVFVLLTIGECRTQILTKNESGIIVIPDSSESTILLRREIKAGLGFF